MKRALDTGCKPSHPTKRRLGGAPGWTHVWGAGTFILTLIGTWILVRHEEEHRAGTMAIILGVLSGVALLALNAYSIYRNLRDASRAKAKDAEIVALRSEHKSLLDGRDRQQEHDLAQAQAFAKSANDDARDLRKIVEEKDKQIRALNEQLAAQQTANVPFTLSPLQREAFQCAQKLREWISAVCPLATPPLIAGESDEERERRIQSARAAYRARLKFEYESGYRDKVQAIYRKFAIENIRDLWIEQFLERIEHNEQALNIADGLEALAIRQFAPTASRLIERQLRPLNETIEL